YSTGFSGPDGIVFDGVNVWVANAVGLNATKVTATGVVRGGKNPNQVAMLHWFDANASFPSLTLGTSPHGVAFDGTNIWVANTGSNTLTKIIAATGGATTVTLTGLLGPTGIAYDPNANAIWVTDAGSNKVTKINASTNAISGSITVG